MKRINLLLFYRTKRI